MSLLKNLKSVFIVEQDNPKEKKVASKGTKKGNQSKNTAIKKPITKPKSNLPISNTPGKVDERFTETLLKSFEANNLDGFDYLEYKQSLEAMRKLNMDEATRYQSAFATASTMGVTLEQLLKTTQHYLTVLNNEDVKFNKALEGKNRESVVNKEKESVQLEQIVQSKQAQIESLKKEIEQHENQLNENRTKLAEAKEKISVTVSSFKASFESLKGQIENDISKMQQYLK